MDIDISKLPFDVEVIKKIQSSKKLFEAFPILKKYDAFELKLPVGLPRAFELIVLLYSMGSELIVRHDTAKAEAAEYFGYRVVDGEIRDRVIAELLQGENNNFNSMVVAYCRLQKNAKFSKLVAYTDAYYANINMLRNINEKDNKEKQKDIMFAIDKLEKDIDSLVNEFLSYDNTASLKNKVFDEIETASLGLRPENIAEKMAAGEQAVDVAPYGKDYKFEKFGDRKKINPHTPD